jgi:hypothetical protein
MKLRKALRLAAWCSIIAIALVTLSPKGTRFLAGGDFSRAVAYLLAGLVFCLAFPRHRVLIALGLISAAGVLEVLQNLIPGRHGHIRDFGIKALAAFAGAAISVPARRALPAATRAAARIASRRSENS